jgi:hypothetical protein
LEKSRDLKEGEELGGEKKKGEKSGSDASKG